MTVTLAFPEPEQPHRLSIWYCLLYTPPDSLDPLTEPPARQYWNRDTAQFVPVLVPACCYISGAQALADRHTLPPQIRALTVVRTVYAALAYDLPEELSS